MVDVDTCITRVATVPSASSVFWREMFTEQFLSVNDPNVDDLVFYVRQSPPAVSIPVKKDKNNLTGANNDNDIIFVRRRTDTNPLPFEDEDNVRWKETFYLNMLVQLEYELTVSICTKGPDNRIREINKEIAKRVYAAPNKTRMDKKGMDYSYSFPLIYFNVEDYESTWSDLVISEGLHYCVRLFVVLPPLGPGLSRRKVPIFAGSVSWNDLSRVFSSRVTPTSVMMEKSEYIMMSGPGGKGHCQVAVNTKPPTTDDAGSSGSLPLNGRGTLRGFIRGLAQAAQVLADKQEPLTSLHCSLTFINVTWQSIVNDLTDAILRSARAEEATQ